MLETHKIELSGNKAVTNVASDKQLTFGKARISQNFKIILALVIKPLEATFFGQGEGYFQTHQIRGRITQELYVHYKRHIEMSSTPNCVSSEIYILASLWMP